MNKLRFAFCFSLAAIMAFIMTGCGDDDLAVLGKKMQKTLGIAVELQARRDDACMIQQVHLLMDDYQKLNDGERGAIKARLSQKYKKFVLAPSVVSLLVTGEAASLSYVHELCRNGNCSIKTKC